jgi:peptidylprolyl isomerase
MADRAENGDKVCVHYTGRLDNGDVFDTSEGGEPLQFEVGAGEVIPGFDDAVRGMKIGDRATVEIKSEDAYGPRVGELVQAVPREGMNLGDVQPETGMSLLMQLPDNNQIPVTITDVTETHVTIDANHPLAGYDLTFDIERVADQTDADAASTDES